VQFGRGGGLEVGGLHVFEEVGAVTLVLFTLSYFFHNVKLFKYYRIGMGYLWGWVNGAAVWEGFKKWAVRVV
jgi:hypothetical protein